MINLLTSYSGIAQSTFSNVYEIPVIQPPNIIQSYSVSNSIDSGYFVSGIYQNRMMVFKTDATGQMLWKISADTNHFIDCVGATTSDSCFIALGTSDDYFGMGNKLSAIKLNNDGDTLWTAAYSIIDEHHLYAAEATSDGGIVTIASSLWAPYFFVIKMNSSGNIVWVRQLVKMDSFLTAYGLTETANGNILVAGHIEYTGVWEQSAFLVKLSESGDLIWSKSFISETSVLNKAFDVAFSDGEYALIGTTDNSVNFISCDTSGTVTSSKVYNIQPFPLMNHPECRITDWPEGGYVFASSAGSLVKIDKSGEPIWSKIPTMYISDIISTNNQGILIAGNGPVSFPKDKAETGEIGLIKTDSLGNNSGCLANFNAYAFNNPIVTSEIDFVVYPFIFDFLHNCQVNKNIELSYEDGCVSTLSSVKEKMNNEMFSIRPNPADAHIIIELIHELKIASNICLYDIQGNLLINQTLNRDEKEVKMDVRNLQNGFYFIIWKSQDKKISKQKLIISH